MLNEQMKAAVYKGKECIVVETVAKPLCPEKGILIQIHYCGICGGDIRNYRNGLRHGIEQQIMGHEIVGEVVEIGIQHNRFSIGDMVALAPDVSCGICWYCKRGLVNLCDNHRMLGTHFPGGFAEYMGIDSEVLSRGFVELVPADVSAKDAALAEPLAGVLAAQELNKVSLGETVVVVGDGAIGCMHVEIARARGASQVIMLARGKLELARTFNADLLLDNRQPDYATRTVLEQTGGRGADIVILAVPNTEAQQQAIDMVRKRGTVVIYGGVPRTAEITHVNSNTIHYGEISLVGAFSYPATGLSDALEAIAAGNISPKKYIGAVMPLAEIVDGMNMVSSGEALKVLIDPRL